jgi:Uma2 family endonuclease
MRVLRIAAAAADRVIIGTFMPVEVLKHRFTVDEFHRLGEARVLSEDDRVELIDGDIVHMTPIGPRHASCVRRLIALLPPLAAGRAIVDVQDPLRLGTHDEPQPDVVLLTRRPDFYRDAHPGPTDALLVIEIADASIAYDRTVKLQRYGVAGVREVWIVNLSEDLIEVYRHAVTGAYQERLAVGRGQSLAVPGLAPATLAVHDILG